MPSREEKQRRKTLYSKVLQRDRSGDGSWPPDVISSTEQIKSPLWDLMVSTNNCYPGCSCDDDFFEMTAQRVQQWVDANDMEDMQRAVRQLNELLHTSIEISSFSYQVNRWMETKEEAIAWLEEWNTLLQQASNQKSGM